MKISTLLEIIEHRHRTFITRKVVWCVAYFLPRTHMYTKYATFLRNTHSNKTSFGARWQLSAHYTGAGGKRNHGNHCYTQLKKHAVFSKVQTHTHTCVNCKASRSQPLPPLLLPCPFLSTCLCNRIHSHTTSALQ